MFRHLLVAAALGLAASTGLAAEQVGGPNAFSFVALGDMPYKVAEETPGLDPANDDYVKFDRLIGAINALKPAFSIHVGDIKSGGSSCTDARFRKVLDRFQSFEQPLIYAIGDNEWVDCHRHKQPAFDPRERLAKLREMFFANPQQSLGKKPMRVESQATMPAHAAYVENLRFTHNGVLFVSLNIPGSNNGFETINPQAAAEFFARNAANIAWIDDSFRLARVSGIKAVVLAFQANPTNIRQDYPGTPQASGFYDTVNAIEQGALAFARPVLIVQGDNHVLELAGFRNVKDKPVPNVLRLQVMGETQVHAVRVIVDPDSAGVFGFVPLIVPENGPF